MFVGVYTCTSQHVYYTICGGDENCEILGGNDNNVSPIIPSTCRIPGRLHFYYFYIRLPDPLPNCHIGIINKDNFDSYGEIALSFLHFFEKLQTDVIEN